MDISTDKWILLQKNIAPILSTNIAKVFNLNKGNLIIEVPQDESKAAEELKFLKKMNLIKFEADLKVTNFFEKLQDIKHPIKIFVYYKNKLCGYAFGEVINSDHSIVIHHMEKRHDCDGDLRYMFLPIVIEVISAYFLILKSLGLTETLRYLRLVNPVEYIISYYEKNKFYVGDYKYKGIVCKTATYDISLENK